ncbi:MAG: hypothetical protein A2X49_07780 [Lentisphaerae bacterium GWF2_52_8]|nr:MAG: hypothetical protein A2X49_07780 [Lentisphaerae bacterium GWF2_52_8]
MIRLNEAEYRDKTTACWLGKNIGGTLGMPFEWRRQANNVSFYTQALDGAPVPNDDLDIQLVWLMALEEQGIDLDAHTLAEYWSIYLSPHWSEYGISKSNMRIGLPPPLCGSFDNKFKHSCGAFIRSEIWACIAPGTPSLAVRYAYEDAILDHGDGEGTYAEVFTAAIESAAFVIPDIRKLLAIGLSYIPSDCAVAKAANAVIEAFDAGQSWQDIREMILRDYRGKAQVSSKEDLEKGFNTGEVGFDVPSNIAIVVLGLLHGEKGDFDKMICTTVNCGEDTDCTAATVGSIYGIIHGCAGIPEKWIKPIGRGLKTCCINIGDMAGLLPGDIDALTLRVESVMRQVVERRGKKLGISISNQASTGIPEWQKMLGSGADEAIYKNMNKVAYKFPFYSIVLDYDGKATIKAGEEKRIKVKVLSDYGRVQANISVRIYAPEGWKVSPQNGVVHCIPGWYENIFPEFELSFHAGESIAASNRCTMELTIEGRPGAMLVPITLINGNLL